MNDAVLEKDPILDTDFIKEMARQMRALDTYGSYQGWTVEKILDPFVLVLVDLPQALSSTPAR